MDNQQKQKQHQHVSSSNLLENKQNPQAQQISDISQQMSSKAKLNQQKYPLRNKILLISLSLLIGLLLGIVGSNFYHQITISKELRGINNNLTSLLYKFDLDSQSLANLTSLIDKQQQENKLLNRQVQSSKKKIKKLKVTLNETKTKNNSTISSLQQKIKDNNETLQHIYELIGINKQCGYSLQKLSQQISAGKTLYEISTSCLLNQKYTIQEQIKYSQTTGTQEDNFEFKPNKIKYLLKLINQKRQARYLQNNGTTIQILRVYDNFMKTLSQKKIQLLKHFEEEKIGLGPSMKKTLELIKANKFNDITDDIANQVYYENKLNNVSQQLLKKTLQQWSIQKDILNNTLRQMQNLYFIAYNTVDSNIVDTKMLIRLKNMFPKAIKGLKLLFRASKDGFGSNNFHSKCNGIADTVTIVKTQFGKIIGGYTPNKWDSNSGHYVQDPSLSSFVFSLTNNEKFHLADNYKTIYCDPNYGPTFGGGHDLHISNGCNSNSNSNSYANIPYSYSNQKYQNNQASYTMFSGQTNGYKFVVSDYEVFQIEWK